MKKCLRMLRICGLMAAVMLLSAVSAFAAETDWNASVITVEGMGIPPANAYNAVQARMLARRAAMVDAYRQIAEAVKGVNVDSETTVENMMILSDRTTTRVDALVQGARIVDEYTIPEGGYAVKMQVPLFGVSNSVASAVMERPTKMEAFPPQVPSVAPSTSSISVKVDVTPTSSKLPTEQPKSISLPAGRAAGNFTGLIVDCRGLGLKPVMSPVIKNANGTPIYGYKNLDYDKVISSGMAGYTKDITNSPRAGSNPLVVRAVSLENHNGNPVISVADANRVLMENNVTKFLDKTNVVFVR